MTTKATNQGGSGAGRAQTDTPRAAVSQGSSTTAAADPVIPPTTRSAYDPHSTGYNPSTGTGYNTAPPEYSSQDYRADYAPSTINKESRGSTGAASKGSTESTSQSTERMSDKLGYGIRSAIASIHGAGETLRGSLTSAVDKASGDQESAAKNGAIAAEGEREVQSGRLLHHESERRSKK